MREYFKNVFICLVVCLTWSPARCRDRVEWTCSLIIRNESNLDQITLYHLNLVSLLPLYRIGHCFVREKNKRKCWNKQNWNQLFNAKRILKHKMTGVLPENTKSWTRVPLPLHDLFNTQSQPAGGVEKEPHWIQSARRRIKISIDD